MKWFNDLKIGTKLQASFVLVALIAGLIGWVGISGVSKISASAASMYADRLVPIRDLGVARATILTVRGDLRAILLTKSMTERGKYVVAIDEQAKIYNDVMTAYQKTVLTKEQQETLAKLELAMAKYRSARKEAIALALKGQDSAALKIFNGEVYEQQEVARLSLNKLIDINARVAEEVEKANEASAAATKTQILTFLGVGVVLALAMGFVLSRLIGTPLRAMQAAAEKLATGDVNVKVELDSKDELGALAKAFRAMTETTKDRAVLAQKIAAGDVTVEVQAASEQDVLGKAFILVVQSLRKLIAESDMLTKAAVEGKLATRGNAEQFQGGYRQIVIGVNQTLDAVIGPLNVSAEYVDRISKGDIPPKITDKYNGDFNEIKNNLNVCIDSISRMVGETAALVQSAADGKLTIRADATKHQGDFRKIIEGLNEMLDTTLLPIGESNRILAQISGGNLRERVEITCKGDHEKMKQAVNGVHDSLSGIVSYITKIANGDMTASVAKASDKDQIHEWLVLLKSNINALVADTGMLAEAVANGKLATRAAAGKHQGAYRTIIEGVNETLDAIVEPLKITAQNATTLAASSEQLTAVSQQMAGNAEETATQANVVSAASEEVSTNVASVAAASEQMQASIREISKNANESARVAKNAVKVAQATNETVKKLGESSQEIGNVIKVITSIAQQTNLLALNATIEAARAGEAGKGFAVVANEVKELAKQTAKATEDIGQRIDAIQGDTTGAVKAIAEIGAIINQINDISNSIASAVEEQTVTTNEIGRSVTEASKGVGDIAKNIGGVAVAAKNTTQGANDTQQASHELSQMASRLQSAISRFTF